MGVGITCPSCRENFPFCCSNCDSYDIVVHEASKILFYFQPRTMYYFQCKRCGFEYDHAICPSCSKDIIAQFPYVAGDTEDSRSRNCFIATACLGDNTSIVQELYEFRDTMLAECLPGRKFIALYYRFSPGFAHIISRFKPLNFLAKYLLVYPVYFTSLSAKTVRTFVHRFKKYR